MGREEKAKRARQKAAREAQGEAAKAGEPGGTPAPDPVDPLAQHAEQALTDQAGGHWASRPGGKGEAENARLVRQAARWNTAADASTFTGADANKLTARDVAVLVTRRGMLGADARIVPTHVSNLIRMEGHNLREDLQYDPFLNVPAQAASNDEKLPEGGTVIGQQIINFYLPANNRENGPPAGLIIDAPPATNGHAADSNGHA